MAKPVIKVEQVSKKFVISHESPERYTSLRDVISKKASNMMGRRKAQDQARREVFYALNDINFDVQAGDRVGIIGRNGAGKSTLLKVLSRITEPSSGRISITGRVASLLEVGTGFHPELTGRENIFLNGAILGMSRAEIRRKFDEIVSFAEVEKFLDTPVKRYSSGMYVRLAFAVAAHLEPEILIVDEVLAVGDSQFQKKCLGKMEDVSKNEGRTVLFVSHNMGVIAQLCNVAILLNKGTVEANGSVNTIVDRYISNSGNADTNSYMRAEDAVNNKTNYFNKICTVNAADEVIADFSFDEEIRLKFDFTLNEIVPNLQIGIAMLNKFQSRVFTILKPVTFFDNYSANRYRGTVTLPSSTIAPNIYSFVFQIWVKDADVSKYDNLENICSVKIHDSGTEYAIYEGYDYGNVIINANWATK
ncbi:MAG: ATP-binding cassette domain-containing protein [Chitinophagaceae bacterium]|nr:ATP-binding cassette domain-containing protein [Chitinophagaceae bacterium]